MTSFLASFILTGCSPLAVEPVEGRLRVHASGNAPDAACPTCNVCSGRVHSYYTRSAADLPISDQPVQLLLRLRRFRCLNEDCPRSTFSEPLPNLLPAHARRTNRLANRVLETIDAIGEALAEAFSPYWQKPAMLARLTGYGWSTSGFSSIPTS